MRAVKGNKQYTINESQKKFYQDGGFDIYDDEGRLISYGRDKKIPYEDYSAVKEELENLKRAGNPGPAPMGMPGNMPSAPAGNPGQPPMSAPDSMPSAPMGMPPAFL